VFWAVIAVTAVTVAVTGMLSRSATQSHPVSAGTPSAMPAEPSASQRVEGGALVEPSVRPTPAASVSASAPRTAPSPGTLCREYYSFLAHQQPPASLTAEAALEEKLDALAGGHLRVFTYCFRYLDYMSWGKAPGPPPQTPAQDTHAGGPVSTPSPSPSPSQASSSPSPSQASSGAGKAGPGNTGDAGAGNSGATASATGRSGAGGSGSQTGSGPR